MTDEELQCALTEAAAKGAAKAIELHAAALRAAIPPPKPAKQHNPMVIAGLVVAMISPIGGGIAWVNSLSSRVPVVEATNAATTSKLATLDGLSTQLAALKQELSDFRLEWQEQSGRR